MTMMYDELGNPIGDFTDENSGGATGSWGDPNPLTLDYYRQKVVQFQDVLILLDATGRELYEVGMIAYASENPDMIAEYEGLREAFDSKRASYAATAEGIQLASKGLNTVGIDFPSIQLPMGLGLAPLPPLVAAAAVIAGAVALITWAQEFWRAVREFAQRWQHINAIENLPESERAGALEALRKMELQAQEAEAKTRTNPLSSLADIGKWVAIAGGLFLAYKLFMDGNRNGNR